MKNRVDLNFKVSVEFKYLFNNCAARHGISGKELLERLMKQRDSLAPDDHLSINRVEQQRVSYMSESKKHNAPAIIAQKVAELNVSVDQIAGDLGYRSADFLRLLIAGEARLPLDAVQKFAAVLGINFVELCQAALRDYGLDAIAAALKPEVSAEELELILVLRRLLKANG